MGYSLITEEEQTEDCLEVKSYQDTKSLFESFACTRFWNKSQFCFPSYKKYIPEDQV